jgi:hypothetical protein
MESLSEENRRIRLLRTAADLVMKVIAVESLSMAEAVDLIENTKKLALRLFPDKRETFDIIYMPRFRRALREAGFFKTEDVFLRLVRNQDDFEESFDGGPST